MARGPREVAYDEGIAPLMAEIIARAKAAGIPFVASFALEQGHDDGPLFCTTVILPEIAPRRLEEAAALLYRPYDKVKRENL